MNAISILMLSCVLISLSPLRAEQGVSDGRIAKGSAVPALRGLDDHNTVPPLRVYRLARDAGYSDEEIRNALLERIHQKNRPKERRAPSIAVKAANAALDLFRGDPLCESTVLQADRPAPEHYPPEYAEVLKDRCLMWSAIARHGSDELVQDYKELHKDVFNNSQSLRVFDEQVSARPRFHRDRVPEELKIENRLRSQDVSMVNSPHGKQSGPDIRPQRTAFGAPSVVSQWPWLLGLCGLGMVVGGFLRKWRAVWLVGVALMVVSAAFLIFTYFK